MRLDIFISKNFPGITRSQAKRLIEEGGVSIDAQTCLKPHHNVKGDENIFLKRRPSIALDAAPQDIPLDILYEDKDLIVINKPAGMVVHPAAGNKEGTLVNALLYHCKDLSGIGGVERPGIVHRLDKGTSGVMVVAKNDAAHTNLSAQFKDRTVEKRYYALLYGRLPDDSGVISAPIGRHVSDRKKMSVKTRHGRIAETVFKVIRRFGAELTMVDIRLNTGRTHQIRVHFSHLGHPLVGDDLYGGTKTIKRLKNSKLQDFIKLFSRPALHAYRLSFDHPITGKRMEFAAQMPPDLEVLLDDLARSIHQPLVTSH